MLSFIWFKCFLEKTKKYHIVFIWYFLVLKNLYMKTTFVIFGSTGDLAKRKLIPALYNIFRNQSWGDINILWVGRRNFDGEDFLKYIEKKSLDFVEFPDRFNAFLKTISYKQVEISDVWDYKKLKKKVESLSDKKTEIIYYLSISPKLFPVVIDNFKSAKLNNKNVKIIFEKPFWTDLKTAKELNSKISEVFSEKQVYRIDHYVWKEAIQNILAFRFTNILFEPLWNNKYIDNIQITASEEVWVGDRAGYYDTSWALRDMIQNHLFQVLSLITMDVPDRIDSGWIRTEKVKVFRNLKLDPDFTKDIVFGQYEWYLGEKWIKENSRTETFVALKMEVCNWRFSWVPIYLRTWKALNEKSTKIVIEFKEIPNILFKKFWKIERNRIILEVQPNEWIDISFNIKENGSSKEIQNVVWSFSKELIWKEAYQKLIEDVIVSDKTLFTSWNMLKQTWKIVDELVNCRDNCPMLFKYDKWTSWPKEMDELLSKDWRKWY